MMTPAADPRLIVPLDQPGLAEARALVAQLGDRVSFYKVGLELFARGGMELARELKGQGKQVFLDWKLHDIGATVERAAAALSDSGCDLLTVHAEPQVMAAAVRGVGQSGLKVLAVTVLTSLSDADLKEIGYASGARSLVERRIHQALEAGCAGVVASPQEAELARKIGGKDFLVVTPGVRPAGAAAGDQKRVATPRAAMDAGADYLVVGRPIRDAADPRAAAEAIVAEMSAT